MYNKIIDYIKLKNEDIVLNIIEEPDNIYIVFKNIGTLHEYYSKLFILNCENYVLGSDYIDDYFFIYIFK